MPGISSPAAQPSSERHSQAFGSSADWAMTRTYDMRALHAVTVVPHRLPVGFNLRRVNLHQAERNRLEIALTAGIGDNSPSIELHQARWIQVSCVYQLKQNLNVRVDFSLDSACALRGRQ
jgi:hypothetical protein